MLSIFNLFRHDKNIVLMANGFSWISPVNMLIGSIVHGFARALVKKLNPDTLWLILDSLKVE